MSSITSFVRPYGFTARNGADSSMGSRSGSPYTVHDDENTSACTPWAPMRSSSVMVDPRFVR